MLATVSVENVVNDARNPAARNGRAAGGRVGLSSSTATNTPRANDPDDVDQERRQHAGPQRGRYRAVHRESRQRPERAAQGDEQPLHNP